MLAQGLIDGTLPACGADCSRFVTRAPGTGQPRWLGDVQLSATLLNWDDWMSAAYSGFAVTLPSV
jgi:hypothetical protein